MKHKLMPLESKEITMYKKSNLKTFGQALVAIEQACLNNHPIKLERVHKAEDDSYVPYAQGKYITYDWKGTNVTWKYWCPSSQQFHDYIPSHEDMGSWWAVVK